MTRLLAFTQFLIVSLGAFTLHLLVKLGGHEMHSGLMEDFSRFLARYALWFFAVPILYAACGTLLPGGLESRPLRITGLVLCGILAAAFGLPLFHYLA